MLLASSLTKSEIANVFGRHVVEHMFTYPYGYQAQGTLHYGTSLTRVFKAILEVAAKP